MADLVLRADLVERIQDIARREARPVDDVIEALLAHYTELPEPPLPSDHSPDTAARLRQDKLRLYERARRYWRRTNDPRQHLSDEALDEQFWVFDHEGIPRLKSDQDSVQLPVDPFQIMLTVMQSNPAIVWRNEPDSSERAKEIFNTDYTDYLLARMNEANHIPDAHDEHNSD